jgi:predicted DNA-binding transcriptional regulator AlpA
MSAPEAPASLRARTLPLDQRLLVTTTEAAALLGISRDLFRAEIAPDLRAVKLGRRTHWPVAELERWVGSHMQPAAYD